MSEYCMNCLNVYMNGGKLYCSAAKRNCYVEYSGYCVDYIPNEHLIELYERIEDSNEIIKDMINGHDNLVAQAERLNKENSEIKQNYNERLDDLEGVLHNMGKFNDRLKQENKQLRTVLGLINPFEEINELMITFKCRICNNKDIHADDCQYVKLLLEVTE